MSSDRPTLSIFDNAATGGFHVRSRGYDREQVERYVRKLEDKLREATARGAERAELLTRAEEKVGELSGEVTSLRVRVEAAETKLRSVDQPSFASLGEHVATLLASAEEQAAQLTAAAATDAERTRTDAATQAERLRAEARDHAEQLRREAEEHRRQVSDDAARLKADAEAQSARLRQEAQADATAARVQAVDEAQALLADARSGAASLRTAAEVDAEAQREAAAALLHDARQRADHQVGAVTSGLGALRERLLSQGSPVAATRESAAVPVAEDAPAGAEPEQGEPSAAAGARTSPPAMDDETQLFPVVDR
jgi:cell division septum initiation protein DivIVA